MAKTTSLYVTQTIKTPNRQITAGDTTTALQLQIGGVAYAVGADQAVLKSLMLTSTDSAACNIQIRINDGTNERCIGTVPVVALAGTTGAFAAVDALNPDWLPGLIVDKNGKYVLPLGASSIIKIAAVATLTAAKVVDAVAVVEEY
jgi:hypothetical protein